MSYHSWKLPLLFVKLSKGISQRGVESSLWVHHLLMQESTHYLNNHQKPPNVCVYKCCPAVVILTFAVGQSLQATQSSRAGKMWSARGTRRSSPAQPWAASQLPPSDGWKERKNWQVSRITASPSLLHKLQACPLPSMSRSLETLPLWTKWSFPLKH